MPALDKPDPKPNFQAQFHSRWNHLHDRHVRALAWLLSAPDLLDWQAPQWQGKIARLPADPRIDDWLAALERAPQPLHDWLAPNPRMRLGHYAEKLLAFYFRWQGILVTHGMQVRDAGHATIGEFDFLLRAGAALLHLEFAAKFYLLQGGGRRRTGHFIGPGLDDSLEAKMRTLLERQLALGRHPAAQRQLTQAPAAAQALLKGWLFYPLGGGQAPPAGLSATHCRGFWCRLEELEELPQARYALLPRLDWLAPARVPLAECVDRSGLERALAARFAAGNRPALVARLTPDGAMALETERGFLVPDDWPRRAGERIDAWEKAMPETGAGPGARKGTGRSA